MRTGIVAHFIYCYILMPPTVPDTQKALIQILSNGWVTEFPLSQRQSSTTVGHFKPLSIGTFPSGFKRTKVFTVLKSFLLTPSPPVVTLPLPFSPRLPNFLQKSSVFAVFNFLSFRFLPTTICLLLHHCTAVALLKVNDHHSGDKTSSDLSCPLCRHIGESPNPDSRIREGWCCCQFLSS